MGLNDIVPEDAGDAKGGRPPEDNPTRPEHQGNVYTESDDNKEYWREVYEENTEGDELDREGLLEMSSYAAVRTSLVKQKLTQYGIHEFTQDDIEDHDPIHMRRGNWAGGDNSTISSGTTSSSGGLMGLVEDAKEQD